MKASATINIQILSMLSLNSYLALTFKLNHAFIFSKIESCDIYIQYTTTQKHGFQDSKIQEHLNHTKIADMESRSLTGEELEKLFLLELLVDKIEIDWNRVEIEKEELNNLKEHCLRFQFLNYPIIEICEEDFCETTEDENGRSEVIFKSGKSCLFSLRSSTPELKCFMIRATLLRKKDPPPHQIIGKSCINLGDPFIGIINTVQTAYDNEPSTEIIKDKYSILNCRGSEIGKLTLLTRLSSFGKMIITEFQISDEEKNAFLFKSEATKTGEVAAGSDNAYVSTRKGPCCDGDQRAQVSQLGPPQPDRFVNFPCNLADQSRTIQDQPMAPGLSFPAMHTQMQQPQAGIIQQQVSMTQASFGVVQPSLGTVQPSYGTAQPYYGAMQPSFGTMQPPVSAFGPVGPMANPRLPDELLGGAGGLFGGSPYSLMGGTFPNILPPPMGLLGGNPENIYATDASYPSFNPMNYKDIGLTANGRPIDIKVAKQQKKAGFPAFPFCGKIPRQEESSSSSSDEEDELPLPPQPAHPPLNFCDCDYPLPSWYGAQCPPPPPKKKKKKKKKKKPKCPFDVGGKFCYKPECPMGYPLMGGGGQSQCTQMQMPPGTIALMEDQVVFNVPTPSPQPPVSGYSTAWDPNDLFSMKVGRRMNVSDQNTKVELQYEPKPDMKKTCRMEVETQYSPVDFGGTVDTGGGDKGKDKKKGKGGKKGKK